MRNHEYQQWWWAASSIAKEETTEEIKEENDNVNIEMQVDNWKVENE